MSTVIRPVISKKNEYYISRHRYYELKHFCLQYKEWKRIYDDLCSSMQPGIIKIDNRDVYFDSDRKHHLRERYLNNIHMIEESAAMTDKYIGPYILKGVTEGLPYTYFKTNGNIPCCKDIYYELYRRFFWILSKKKESA